ncbi:MAG: KxYKxGKxW signal peptide domain-containing protein [Flavobacteriales bacterium]|nr:KxYKxGKxW signal peptide domain-containing protein [Flavobacteriales bacterium]
MQKATILWKAKNNWVFSTTTSVLRS